MEHGGESLLKEILAQGALTLTTNPAKAAGVPTIIITIGTPVDEFLNPDLKVIKNCVDDLLPFLSDEQLIVLRSTVCPGTTEWLSKYLLSKGKHLNVSFCPERVVQGHAIEELQTFPQIVSGVTPEAEEAAAKVFRLIAPSIVRLTPIEAEFAKLFSNASRYIQFALSNQFYMIAVSAGVDYYRILEGAKKDYTRMRDLAGAGFAAGPCLFKDIMQLVAFSNNQFSLGQAAMLINEGLPLFIVDRILKRHDLERLTVGLLGMAFKADIDDPRSSLSYKLKKLLTFRAKAVLTTDPYVEGDRDILPLEEVVGRSELLILCVPHSAYRKLKLDGKMVVDVWNFWEKGGYF
jgi:UDP-N-acetyl-D-mannosaminuronic acid dehydrogenase